MNFYQTTAVIASALCFAHFVEAFVHRDHMSIMTSIIFYGEMYAVEAQLSASHAILNKMLKCTFHFIAECINIVS